MRAHKQETNKIGETSVAYHYQAQYFPPGNALEDLVVLPCYSQAGSSLMPYGLTKSLTQWNNYRSRDEEFLPGETEVHADDEHDERLSLQPVVAAWLDGIVLFADNTASAKSINLEQIWLRQLLRRLRKAGESKVAGRIEYLSSEANAEDGGDIPTIVSVASFVKFYLDNRNLGRPLLGVTPDGDLQAVWMLSDQRRLVAEFMDDDIVKYVYRRSGNMRSSKLFTLGQQPLHKIRGLLENASI